jgi:hypothetical protein
LRSSVTWAMQKIDDVLEGVVETDPRFTITP